MTFQWKYPEFNVPSNLSEVTDEMLDKWEKEKNDCVKYNEDLQLKLKEIKARIISDAKCIWGEKFKCCKISFKTKDVYS